MGILTIAILLAICITLNDAYRPVYNDDFEDRPSNFRSQRYRHDFFEEHRRVVPSQFDDVDDMNIYRDPKKMALMDEFKAFRDSRRNVNFNREVKEAVKDFLAVKAKDQTSDVLDEKNPSDSSTVQHESQKNDKESQEPQVPDKTIKSPSLDGKRKYSAEIPAKDPSTLDKKSLKASLMDEMKRMFKMFKRDLFKNQPRSRDTYRDPKNMALMKEFGAFRDSKQKVNLDSKLKGAAIDSLTVKAKDQTSDVLDGKSPSESSTVQHENIKDDKESQESQVPDKTIQSPSLDVKRKYSAEIPAKDPSTLDKKSLKASLMDEMKRMFKNFKRDLFKSHPGSRDAIIEQVNDDKLSSERNFPQVEDSHKDRMSHKQPNFDNLFSENNI